MLFEIYYCEEAQSKQTRRLRSQGLSLATRRLARAHANNASTEEIDFYSDKAVDAWKAFTKRELYGENGIGRIEGLKYPAPTGDELFRMTVDKTSYLHVRVRVAKKSRRYTHASPT